MDRKLDALISLAVALAVTALFVGNTLARWPDPFRLQKFAVQRENPAAFRHVAPTNVALSVNN
jgi:hypothetical protein